MVNSFIGSTAFDATNHSTTASCATATRDTQSRFARPALMADSLYLSSGRSATAMNRPASTSSSRTGPEPGRPPGTRASRGRRSAAITPYTYVAFGLAGFTVYGSPIQLRDHASSALAPLGGGTDSAV